MQHIDQPDDSPIRTDPITDELELASGGSRVLNHIEPGVYDSESITVLEGLDAVRKRPGMYIGSTGERGLHHLVYEVVDNSVDEALAGYCDTILSGILPEGGIQVVDNGRGIPVKEHPTEKIPAVTLALTVLHAGGKFGDGGYKVSGGLHGVGVSVVNALSAHLDVEVKRDGYRWTQDFSLGDPGRPAGAARSRADETGTTVTFYASPEIFETTDLLLRDPGHPVPGDGVPEQGPDHHIVDERARTASRRRTATPFTDTFRYDDGLIDYVKLPDRQQGDGAHPTVIAVEAERPESGMSLEVAMQWNISYTESVHTFANTINTHEGGTHEEGFRAALTNTANKWGENWGLIKKTEDRLSGDDIREGLTAIISVKLAEPQFEGQTKTKLGNTEARSFVQQVVNAKLGDWFEQNPAEGKLIIRKGQAAAIARIAARKARDAARDRKGLLGGSGLPGKLARLPVDQPRGVRGLHRRGRLGRRFGQGWPRPADPGDPADPRQDPERREGADRPDPAEQRGPGDHLRPGHRGARGLRHRQAALSQDRHDGRRRRGRRAHPYAAADLDVPLHAAADRGRPRLPRPAAAVPDRLEQRAARAGVHRRRAGRAAAGRRRGGQAAAAGERHPALQGSGGDEPRPALGHHHGPGQPGPAAGHPGRRRPRRRDVLDPDGRGRRAAALVHPAQRQGRPVP